MAQIVLKHPDKLIQYIDQIPIKSDPYVKNIIIQLEFINPSCTNILVHQTSLPYILIEIINSYSNELLDIYVDQINSGQIDGEYHKHIGFTSIKNNFLALSFSIVQCFSFWYIKNKGKIEHRAASNIYNISDSIIEQRFFDKKVSDYANKYSYNIKQYNIKQYNIKQILSNESINWHHKSKHAINYFVNCTGYDIANHNIFFNKYCEKTNQKHNIIEHNFPNINIDKNNDSVNDIDDDCKFIKNLDCYVQISVKKNRINMIEHKIKNHEKLTDIIAINKLLYDFVEKRVIDLCHNFYYEYIASFR